jgi:hypothetical protein
MPQVLPVNSPHVFLFLFSEIRQLVELIIIIRMKEKDYDDIAYRHSAHSTFIEKHFRFVAY